jgi:putative resolvase
MSIFLSKKQAREFLNITRTTILRWEELGQIKVYKTSGGHRRYLKSDLEKLIGMNDMEPESRTKSGCVIYTRVLQKSRRLRETWIAKLGGSLPLLLTKGCPFPM